MTTKTHLIFNGPAKARRTIALAHGAGAGMSSPFMNAFAEGLADEGLRVARFEFPYMAERRRTEKKKPPDREAKLLETWRDVIDQIGINGLIIGGKSMGGRMASLVADEVKPVGLVCLGYPFHPAGKPDRLRIEHLKNIKTPTLILQGTRDSLGNREEVSEYELSPNVSLVWLEDGDHSFKPRKSSGRTEEQNWNEAIAAINSFVQGL